MIPPMAHHRTAPTPPRPQASRRADARRRAQAALLLVAVATAGGCGSGDPFRYTRVSGDVRYRDGNPLECADLRLSFYPQQEPKNGKTHPRPGSAVVDARTGKVAAVTTRAPGDGLVAGRHKVTLHTTGRAALPIDVVGPEYADPTKTPLEVDTDKLPFHLKVQRPAIIPVRGVLTYENGSPVQVADAVCGFHIPQTGSRSRDFREIGSAAIDAQTGQFSSVTRGDDTGKGLFAGTYRVTIRAADGQPLPATSVPEIYADPRTTPLTVDAATSPVTLAIPKP